MSAGQLNCPRCSVNKKWRPVWYFSTEPGAEHRLPCQSSKGRHSLLSPPVVPCPPKRYATFRGGSSPGIQVFLIAPQQYLESRFERGGETTGRPLTREEGMPSTMLWWMAEDSVSGLVIISEDLPNRNPWFRRVLRSFGRAPEHRSFHFGSSEEGGRREADMEKSFWQDLAGGSIGGVVGLSVVYPLDTVKCR